MLCTQHRHEWERGTISGTVCWDSMNRHPPAEEKEPEQAILYQLQVHASPRSKSLAHMNYTTCSTFSNKPVTDVAVHVYTGSQRKEDRSCCVLLMCPSCCTMMCQIFQTRITRQPRRGLDCGSSRTIATHPNIGTMKETSFTRPANPIANENEFEKAAFALCRGFRWVSRPLWGSEQHSIMIHWRVCGGW